MRFFACAEGKNGIYGCADLLSTACNRKRSRARTHTHTLSDAFLFFVSSHRNSHALQFA